MPVSAMLRLVIHPFMVVPLNDSSRAKTAGQMLYSQMLPIVTYDLLRGTISFGFYARLNRPGALPTKSSLPYALPVHGS